MYINLTLPQVGGPSLEAAWHHLATWPPPTPGHNLALPLLGTVIHTRLSASKDKQPVIQGGPFVHFFLFFFILYFFLYSTFF